MTERHSTSKCCIPTNKNALPCVKNVMRYLSEISFKKVILGQHTQSRGQEELSYIKSVTGRLPALVGFELLSYSPNINYLDTDEECMKEVSDNYGTLRNAWEWADKKGLITFTWHWFSPLGGHSKSFFSKCTDFDSVKASEQGTKEYNAMLSDIDCMAGLLRPFCDAQIPILWRPFHEGEGDWFWWSAGGKENLKKLWRILYDRMTYHHKLNNLIWVWNSPAADGYPGDDTVDIISRDMYPPAHEHTSRKESYDELIKITDAPKIALIGETGTLPSPEKIVAEGAGWASFMTWSHEWCMSEKYTDNAALKAIYDSEYSVAKDNLPKLY